MKRVLPAVLFLCFIGWIISQANTGANNLFFSLVNWLPYGDKFGHFSLYAILTVLTNLAMKFRYFTVLKRPSQLGAFCVAIFATAEEFSQMFLPSRTGNMGCLNRRVGSIDVLTTCT